MSEKVLSYLKNTFEEKKAKNSRYSMRSFAQQLSVEPSMLAKILNGKRSLTFETASKILDKLSIQTSLKNSLLLSFNDSENYFGVVTDDQLIKFSEREQQVQYKWYFFPVLGLIDIDSLDANVSAIAKYLGIDETSAQEAIGVLLKLEAIEEVKVGVYRPTRKSFTVSSSEDNRELLAESYNHFLRESINRVERGDEEGCEFTSMSFSIPNKKIDEARRRIIEFNRSMAAWLTNSDDDKTDLYRLSIQFFPLKKD